MSSRVALPAQRPAAVRPETRPVPIKQAEPATTAAAERKAPPAPAPAPQEATQPKKSSALVKAILLHLEGKIEDAVRELEAGLRAGEETLEIKAALGNLLYEVGRFEDAAKSYREVIGEQPQHPGIHYKLGVCLHRLGRLAEALEEFGRASELSISDWEARLGMGVLLLEMGKPEEALPRFEECLEAKPREVTGLIGMGVALEQTGRIVEAEAAYLTALEEDPSSPDARSNLLRICMARELTDEARKLAGELLEKDSSSRVALEALVELEIGCGNYLIASELCERITKQDPVLFEGWFNRAVCLLGTGSLAEAAQVFGEAVRLRPDHVPAIVAWSIALREAGDLAGARKVLDSALERAPGEVRISAMLAEMAAESGDAEGLEKLISRRGGAEALQFRLGCSLLEAGDFAGAVRVFDECLKRRPEWPEARLSYGLALWRSGQAGEAERVLGEVLKANPRQTEALYAMAYLAVEREDYEGALDVFLKLSSNGERSAELFYNTGLLLQHFGLLEDALANYRDALKERPGVSEALERMGQIAAALDRPEEAKEYWKQAKERAAEAKLEPSRR